MNDNSDKTIDEILRNFQPGTTIKIEIVFPGEYRVSWENEKVIHAAGFPHYYPLIEALENALQIYRNVYEKKELRK